MPEDLPHLEDRRECARVCVIVYASMRERAVCKRMYECASVCACVRVRVCVYVCVWRGGVEVGYKRVGLGGAGHDEVGGEGVQPCGAPVHACAWHALWQSRMHLPLCACIYLYAFARARLLTWVLAAVQLGHGSDGSHNTHALRHAPNTEHARHTTCPTMRVIPGHSTQASDACTSPPLMPQHALPPHQRAF